MARWILVRHGETEWNKLGLIQGQTDTSLSGAGRVQTTALRERLRPVRIDHVFTSDLSRCVETATIAIQGRDLPIERTALLRELSYGEWEGLTWAQAKARDPEVYEGWVALSPNFEPPGGQSLGDLMARLETFAERLREATGEGTVLVVGHGGSLRALAIGLLGLSASHYRTLINPAPASVSIMRFFEGTTAVEVWNDASHHRPLT